MKASLRIILTMFILALGSQLAACGNSNPYIGTWEGTIEIQNPMLQLGMAFANELSGKKGGGTTVPVTLVFTEKEVIVFNGSQENRSPVIYRKDDAGHAFSDDNGKIWQRAQFKDKNNMIIDDGNGVIMNLKKTK